ncbi:putative reverse transcriptase domain-containing protein [Tanacetum coccineum]
MRNIDPRVLFIQKEIDLSYTKWSKQGQNDEPSISAPKPVNATTEFVDDADFASDIPTDGPATVEMVNATKDNFDEDDLVKISRWKVDNKTHKVYENIPAKTINDYPALGTLCGCPYSGLKGCVVCGKDTYCVKLSASSKQRKRTNNKASENQEDTRGRGGKVQKQKRNTTEEEGSSSQVNEQKEKNVAESLVGTLLNVTGKMKDGVNARLDLAELGVKPELFAMQEEDKTTLPLAGYQKYFAKWSCKEVERELAISKESVSETIRWISYGPCATVVKYIAYNINGYTFRTKCHDGTVYQNSGVSVEAIDLHISKEVATTRKAFYYGVLQEIWVLDYRFRKIPLFKCDWVNHRAGGVKRDATLGYTLVDLNNLGHKVDPFILASQARQVFYLKDQIDKKLFVVFKTPPKNYKDMYDEVDDEFSTVIHQHNDNILPRVDRCDLGNELRNDYYRTDCGGVVIRKSK